MVDVFLSSHFSPFRGHYYLPSNFPSSTKGRDKESEDKDGDVEGEDCSSFHSVFSEDESEADRDRDRGGGETPRPLSQSSSRPNPTSGKVAGLTPKPLGYISQRSEKGALGNAGMGESTMPSGGCDMEGSVPTYVDLVSNTSIAPSSFSEYVCHSPPNGPSQDSTVNSAHRLSGVQQMSWRKAQPSDLDSREMLLTVDRGSVLKVWSARRRELSIPVTTATRSISGAGTSCIVTGNFHTHINPDVTLIIESSVLQMLGTNESSGEAVCVSWIEHVTCPASEQRHTSRGLEAPPLTQSTTRNKVAAASSSSSSSRDRSPNMSFADLGSSSFDQSSSHELGVSGVWLSILAPCDYSRKGGDSDCESPFDDAATDDVNKVESEGDGGVCTAQDLKYFQYRFACLSTSMESQQTQAAVWGFGPILPLGAALFPPSAAAKYLFSEVQKSFVVGRFSSSGFGFPFSVDTITVLRDAESEEEMVRESEEDAEIYCRELRSKGRDNQSCLMKITSGSSERYLGHRKEESSVFRGTREPLSYAAEALHNSPAYFTVPTKEVHDILYNTACEGGRDDSNTPASNNRGGVGSGLCAAPSLRHSLPFTADSLAGLAQTNLSPYDSTGSICRTSGPALSSSSPCLPSSSSSSSSSWYPAMPPAMQNIEILSRLGLAEQQQQHQPLEAVTYEILPSIPQAFGLVDLAVPHGKSRRKDKSSEVSASYSVVRSIVVPLSSLKEYRHHSGQGRSTGGAEGDSDTQVLIVLEDSETHGTRLVLWTHRPEQPYSDLDTRCCTDEPVAIDTSTAEQRSVEPDTAAPLSGEGSSYTGERGYIVEIVPDPQYGLGLRLNVKDTVTVVDNFKRHPLTDAPLPCEACLLIRPNDELISINGIDLKGSSLSSAIQAIRNVVQACGGESITLMLCRAPVRRTSALGLNRNPINDAEVEANLVASPCFFWKFCCTVDLDVECCALGSDREERILSTDIGYDRQANEVLLCTLCKSDSGVNNTGDIRELAVFRLDIKDNSGRTLVQCSAISRHIMNSGEDMDRSTTLQLWGHSCPAPDPVPVPTRTSNAALERSIYVSLVTPGALPSPVSTKRDGDRNKAAELTLCCTLTVVEMKLSSGRDGELVDRSSQQRSCVETTVRVVTSSTPDSSIAVSSNGSSAVTPSYGRYSSSRETAAAADVVKSDTGASTASEGLRRIHLLSTPVGTAGDLQR